MSKEELIIYFTTDNISGKKCTEKWLSKNNNNIYNIIIIWCIDNGLSDLSFNRKVYHYVYSTNSIPTCKTCEGEVRYSRFKDGYRPYCSDKCVKSSKEYQEKWKSTWLENNKDGLYLQKRNNTLIKKYGSMDSYKKLSNINRKEIMVEKYGYPTLFESTQFKLDRKKTLIEKYGSENYNNPDKTKSTRISNGTQIDDTLINNFKDYKKVAMNRTITIYSNNKKIINANNLKRAKKEYHIDHIYSIKQGFLNNIPLEIITHPCNLQMIHYKENLIKQDSCWITLESLLLNIINSNFDVKVNHILLKNKYDNVKETSKLFLEKLR